MAISPEILNSIDLYLPKIIASTLCGIIVGIEREFKEKPAGARTMVLICTGCALLTIVSYHISPLADPSRLIAQIITGIGFVGGGVIMKTEDRIIGVTTAAFIWIIATLGIMIGVGYIYTAVFLAFGLVFLSLVLSYIERIIYKFKKHTHEKQNFED